MSEKRYGIIFDASSIAEQLRKYNVNYDQRNTWNTLHLQNQQFAAAGQSTITQDLQSKLDQAYNAALSQQSAIAGSKLGQGQKNAMSQELWQQTSQAYQAADIEASTYKQKLNEQVSTQAANIEGALYQKGKNQADLLNATVDYWSEQVENNPDLMNDPLWSKYFVSLGLDALDETERARYEELERKNLNLIEEARKSVTNVAKQFSDLTGRDIDELSDETALTEYLDEYEQSEAERIRATTSGNSWYLAGDTAKKQRQRREKQIKDLIEQRELAELQSNQDAVLLENLKKKKGGPELDEFVALRDKVTGSRRAMTKDELMAQMVDEEGNLNMAGQDFFDMMFGEKVDESSFGRWLNESNPDLYEFFTSSDQFDYRDNRTQIRDMLGIGTEIQDYQYSFLERMGGMNEGQLRQTFDVFGASIENLAFGKDTVQNISKLSSNITGLMQGLGIDADFERETKIKMTELDKGIKTAIENIVSGKDINSAIAGTVLANIGGGLAGGAAAGGFAGPTGAMVGTIVGGIFGLIQGISTASKDAKNKKDSNKRIKLMIQQEYNKMIDELTLYMQERAQEAEDKFEQSIRRF